GGGAAAVGRRAAVSIDDDLAAGDAAVAVRTADHETSGRIDVEFGVTVHPALRHHLVNEAAHDFLDALLAHLLAVLGRDHDGVGPYWLAILVGERHLALGIRSELVRATGVPRLGHLVQDAVRVEDRRRHQRLGLAAGKAEHDALVARALVFLGLGLGVDATGDVGGLLVHIIFELGQVPMESFLLVADLAHGAPGRLLDHLGCYAL